MVFIAELFWWFETVKPEFVQPRDLQEFKDGKHPGVIITLDTKCIKCRHSLDGTVFT